MGMKDATIMRSMAADYRRQAVGTADAAYQQRFSEWAAYCERMARAIEAALSKKA